MLFVDVVHSIGKTYNNAYMAIENNVEGKEVVDTLWYQYEYINMYNEGKDIGFRTTKRTKSIGMSTFKELLETGKMIIQDLSSIDEISTFIMQTNQSYSAEKGKYDDTVMALISFCYFIRTDIFKELYKAHDLKKELYSDELDQMEEEFCLPIIKVEGNDVQISGGKTLSSNIPDAIKKVMKKEGIMLLKQ